MRSVFLPALLFALLIAPYAGAQQTDYQGALDAYRGKDFRTAVERLRAHVSTTPEAKAYYLLGYASYALNQDQEAAGYFRQAYLIDPGFDPAVVETEFERLNP